MKKIALLSDGWRRYVVYAWVEGVMRKVNREKADISLFHYNCFGNWSHDKDHNIGEYNILNLPDFSHFDGIIIDVNNILDQDVIRHLIGRIKESGKPAVSIGCVFPELYYVGIDNRRPIEEIMDHLFQKHDCKRFVFAGGSDDNFENKQRVEAYLERLDSFGLSREDNPVLHGDYEYITGVHYLESYMKKKEPLPDVFVCANDNIATGICKAAEDYGLKVPDDFLVTGFDNLEKARNYIPQITTVNLDREMIGEEALAILQDCWAGVDVPSHTYVDAEVIYAESCGCPNSGRVNYREYLKSIIDSACAEDIFDSHVANLEGKISKENTPEGMFEVIARYMMKLMVDGYYICVDQGLYKPEMNTHFPVEGLNWQNIKVPLSIEFGKKLHFENLEELTKHILSEASGNSYMFNPIHFGSEAVGFTIFKNPTFLYEWSNLYDMQIGVISAYQNLFRKNQLENAVKELEDIYNRDQLTGIYNRIALSGKIEPWFNSTRIKGIVCAVVFVDADHFKKLNDTYGHEYGDRVLRNIANVLEDNIPAGGAVCRYGGDEFVALYPYATPENLKKFHEKVDKELGARGTSISMGSCFTNSNMSLTLSDYISAADGNMYLEKKTK